MTLLVTAFLLVAAPTPVPGTGHPGVQESDTTFARWSLRVSTAVYQMRDDLLAPLRYVGPALAVGAARERRGAGSETSLEIGAGAAFGLNRFRHRAAAFRVVGTIRHLSEVAVGDSGPDTRLTAGLAVAARTDDHYFFDWDDAHLYWLATYGIGPSVGFERAFAGDRFLRASVDLPVLGFVGRPPEDRRNKVDDLISLGTWLVEPSRRVEFAAVPRLVMLDGRLQYRASERLDYIWGLSFRTAREPRRAVLLEQAFGVEWSPWR